MPYTGFKLKQYRSWKSLRSRNRSNIEEEWSKFEQFAADTAGRPSDSHRMFRKDSSQKWGPNNFEYREDKGTTQDPEYYAKWRRDNPDYNRQYRYRVKYGLTLDQYGEMLKNQDGQCYVCKTPESQAQQGTVRQLAVDHDHLTTEVRKLLDNKCNAILGHAKDSHELLAKLIVYLAEHSKGHNAVLDEAIAILQKARIEQ